MKSLKDFIVNVNERKDNDFSKMNVDDLYAYVCKNGDIETILDMASQYIDKTDERNFLLACLGETIE